MKKSAVIEKRKRLLHQRRTANLAVMKYYAVIDTNVIVSSQLSSRADSPIVQIWDLIMNGDIIAMFNEDILEEYEQVLLRDKFNINTQKVQEIISAIKVRGLSCERCDCELDIQDADDKKFVEVMLSRDDSYLITGNLKHFPSNSRIISPADMIMIIKANIQESSLLNEPGSEYMSDKKREILNKAIAATLEIRQSAKLDGIAEMDIADIDRIIREYRNGKKK